MYVLSFVTRLMTIKSKFVFSNNCYKELLKLFSDVFPTNHRYLETCTNQRNCFLVSVWIMRRLMFAKIIACFSGMSI
jgi:hypothetical protein